MQHTLTRFHSSPNPHPYIHTRTHTHTHTHTHTTHISPHTNHPPTHNHLNSSHTHTHTNTHVLTHPSPLPPHTHHTVILTTTLHPHTTTAAILASYKSRRILKFSSWDGHEACNVRLTECMQRRLSSYEVTLNCIPSRHSRSPDTA